MRRIDYLPICLVGIRLLLPWLSEIAERWVFARHKRGVWTRPSTALAPAFGRTPGAHAAACRDEKRTFGPGKFVLTPFS